MRFHQAILGVILAAFLTLLPNAAYARQNVPPAAIPMGQPGETYYAVVPMAITLDGNMAEWSNIPYASVTNGPRIPPRNRTTSMRFAAVADSINLYISVEVTDPQRVAGQHGVNYWNEDSVEIYINASGNRSLTSYTSAVAQITIPAVNIGTPADRTVMAGINYEQIGTRAVVVSRSSGYAIEAAIPLHNGYWNIATSDGARIGFQIELNSASQQNRDTKLSWSNADLVLDQSYRNPSLFGELIFTPFVVSTSTPRASATPIRPTVTLVRPTRTATRQSETPTSQPGGFTVRDSRIYDPNGREFVANGTNVNGFNWVWQRSTVGDVGLIDDCWNFNLIRVNSFLFSGQIPYPQYGDNNDLDAIIRTYTSRGIVVVLEAHDRIGSYYQGGDLDTLVNWFTDLANRYQGNPYVWFDVMNEPGGRDGIDHDQWVNMHGRVVQAIRGTGANNIIIVEGAYGGQDFPTDSAILQYASEVTNYNGQQFSNIVFSIHPYDLWNGGAGTLSSFFDHARAQNLAILIGEFAVQTDQTTQTAAEAVFGAAVSRRIGRVVWHWDGGDYNDLTENTSTGGGWEINDCSHPSNLSWLGQQVWNANH